MKKHTLIKILIIHFVVSSSPSTMSSVNGMWFNGSGRKSFNISNEKDLLFFLWIWSYTTQKWV